MKLTDLLQPGNDEAGKVHEGDHLTDGRLTVDVQQRPDDDDRQHRQCGRCPR